MRNRLRRVDATPGASAGPGARDDSEPEELVRDAAESLVAALHESDTAVEAMGDSGGSTPAAQGLRRWHVGLAGLLLAALGILVARRRS
ncbi:MAG: hypothetical protein JWM98_531 [Thermoleophilia bacterium]|nr:hypothetical protein [Thermoleophilia bacterium]